MLTSQVHSVRSTRRLHPGMLLLGVFIVIAALVAGGSAALLPANGHIAQGVTTASVNLSGMTQAAATTALTQATTTTAATRIILVAGKSTQETMLDELGIRSNLAHAVQAAYAVGREGTIVQRIMQAARARVGGVSVAQPFTMDDTEAKLQLEAFGKRIDRVPTDARAHWDGHRVVVSPEQSGAVLDIPAAIRLVHDTVLADLVQHQPVRDRVELPYRAKAPRVTEEMLSAVDMRLGSFSTSYASSSSNRAKNIELASRAINGLVLLPGDTFSFNGTVGQRTAKAGYREAPVIVKGQMDTGLGGGICQVSTTLYNAVLLANLQIVTRNHHSIPSHYVATGLDATVSYGSLDFKFRNSMDTPVVVEMISQGRRLQARVLGQGPAPEVRMVRSNITSIPGGTVTKNDATLPAGTRVVDQKGRAGVTVTVTRVIGSGSDETREVISRDRYPAETTIVRVGTGAAKTTTATPAATGETTAAAPTAN